MAITIAVDFDGTLHTGRYPNIGRPRKDVIDALITSIDRGHVLILHTCRTGDALAAASAWCTDQGIEFTTIWAGPGKPTADLYLDDRAITPERFIASLNRLALVVRVAE